MAKFVGSALVGILIALLAGPAMAQQSCETRASAIEGLAQRYQEQPIGMGLTDAGVVEVLVSKDGATWTMIITASNGCTKFVGAGTYWQQVVPIYKPKGRAS
jgi:hypothetical protein